MRSKSSAERKSAAQQKKEKTEGGRGRGVPLQATPSDRVLALNNSIGNLGVQKVLQESVLRQQSGADPRHESKAFSSMPLEQALPYLFTMSQDEAIALLKRFQQRIIIAITAGEQRIRSQESLRAESLTNYLVGGTAELFGWTSLPAGSWEDAGAHVNAAYLPLQKGQVPESYDHLQKANSATIEHWRVLNDYLDRMGEGADTSVFVLTALRDISFVTVGAIATVVTGGTAGALIGAAATATGQAAEQGMSVHLGVKKEMDWAGLAFDTFLGLALTLIGGRVTARLASAAGKTELVKMATRHPAIGRLLESVGTRIAEREWLQLLQRAVENVIKGRAQSIVQGFSKLLFDDLVRQKGKLTREQVAEMLSQQLTAYSLFMDILGGEIAVQARQYATPAAKAPTPKTEALAPKAETPTPTAEAATAKAEAPTAKAEAPTAKAETPTPKAESTTPKGGQTPAKAASPEPHAPPAEAVASAAETARAAVVALQPAPVQPAPVKTPPIPSVPEPVIPPKSPAAPTEKPSVPTLKEATSMEAGQLPGAEVATPTPQAVAKAPAEAAAEVPSGPARPKKELRPIGSAEPVKSARLPRQRVRLSTREILHQELVQMKEAGISPADLGYKEKQWEQFVADAENNPGRALAELLRRQDIHGVRAEEVSGKPALETAKGEGEGEVEAPTEEWKPAEKEEHPYESAKEVQLAVGKGYEETVYVHLLEKYPGRVEREFVFYSEAGERKKPDFTILDRNGKPKMHVEAKIYSLLDDPRTQNQLLDYAFDAKFTTDKKLIVVTPGGVSNPANFETFREAAKRLYGVTVELLTVPGP